MSKHNCAPPCNLKIIMSCILCSYYFYGMTKFLSSILISNQPDLGICQLSRVL